MKSLKRTLCLVLALVMVLGLFGIASATSFTDDNTIQYKEAVDVATAIGAINGMGDGSFAPKGTITRAQAAKLVTFAVLGETAAKGLVGVSSSFSDVTADNFAWAIPSIEYLVKEGIINGRGDGTFDPNGNITGYEVGKMLLCALGYGKKAEYTGSQWTLNVAIDGGKAGIFDGRADTASAMSAPATREEVALYCFNTIQLPMVEYLSSLDIYAGGGSIGIDKGTIQKNVYRSGDPNGLKKTASDTGVDAFGAPANVWSYNGKTIGAYPVGDVVTYTAKKTVTEVTADLKGYTITSASVSENGKTGTAITTIAGIAGKTENGAVVRVYANTNKAINKVVVVKTDVATVKAVDAARKTVTLEAQTSGAITAQNYTIDSDSKFYSTVAGLAAGDFVLVTLKVDTAGANPEIVSLTIPTQVTGKVTTVNSATNVVYLDGTRTYAKAGTATTAVASIAVDTNNDAILWLDSYGYIVNSKATAATASVFAYVLDGYDTLTDGKIVHMAKVLYPNGTTADIVVNADATPGALVKPGTPTNGVYTLAATNSTNDSGTASGATTNIAKDKYVALTEHGKINAYDKALTAWTQSTDGEATDYYPNYYSSSVKFIYVKDKTATVLEGVQTVTDIPDNSIAIVEDNGDAAHTPVVTAVILPGINPAAIDTSKLVYLPFNASHSSGTLDGSVDLTHTLIAAPIAKTAMLDSSTGKYVTVPVYNGYVNGVQQTTGIPSATTGTTSVTGVAAYNNGGFYTLAADKNVAGKYDLISYAETAGEAAVKVNQNIASAFETILTIDSVPMQTSGATFVDVRTADQQTANPVILNAGGVAAAVAAGDTINVSVVYNQKTGVASLIYINSVTSPLKTMNVTYTNDSAQNLTYTAKNDTNGTPASLATPKKITVNASGASGDSPSFTYTWTIKKGSSGTETPVKATSDSGASYTPSVDDIDGAETYTVKVVIAATGYTSVTKTITLTVS